MTAYDRFVTSMPPDVDSKTHIIAVCGVRSYKATQNVDGWMLSDFAAFWHLLRGMGAKQHWLHCMQMYDVLEANGAYSHGSSAKKVVLNEEIYEDMQKSENPFEEVKSADLASKTMAIVREKVNSIGDSGNVLVILIGLGDWDAYGIRLGQQTLRKSQLMRSIKADVGKATVTFWTTATYSAGWFCDRSFTDAEIKDPAMKQRSGVFSGSLKRACGSLYTIPVFDTLAHDSQNGIRDYMGGVVGSNRDPDPSREQNRSYSNFRKSVYHHLCDSDGRDSHEFAFSAQDDKWGQGWGVRAGVPLSDFEKRWKALEDISISDPEHRPGYSKNQDLDTPKAPDEDIEVDGFVLVEDFLEAEKSTENLRLNNTPEALKSRITELARQYLDTYPGEDECGGNSGQISMRMLVDNHPAASKFTMEEDIEIMLPMIKYRMNLISSADEFIVRFGLKSPDNKSCAEFDTDSLWEEERSKPWKMAHLIWQHGRGMILPWPLSDEYCYQGQGFPEPSMYLAVAFLESGYDTDEIKRMIEEEANAVEEDVKDASSHFELDQELWSKRREKFELLDISKRNYTLYSDSDSDSDDDD